MQYYIFLIIFGLGLRSVYSFWPPAYKVNLSDGEVFVIASDDTDYDDESENEMIRDADLAQFQELAEDAEKYKPLHSHVERYNKRAARTATEFSEIFPLYKPNLEDIHNFVEEAKPFVAGFKHELDNYDFDDLEEHVFEVFRKKRNISNSLMGTQVPKFATKLFDLRNWNWNKVTRPREEHKIISGTTATSTLLTSRNSEIREMRQIPDQADQKSENMTSSHESTTKIHGIGTEIKNDTMPQQTADEEDYDYHLFKAEYYQEMEFSKNDTKTFKHVDKEEPEETIQDAIGKIVDFKMPRNCTREELTQFGAKALECLAYDYQHAKNKKNVRKVLTRTWIVLRVWVCIYLCVVVPCWCHKGWCCCCCTCAFCDPNETILTAKRYYVENPPGILVKHGDLTRKESKTTEFEPTLFELEAYEKFESAIRNL